MNLSGKRIKRIKPIKPIKPIYRLAVLALHPIQYQVPLFRALASRAEVDLQVFFCYRWGDERYRDPGFGVNLSWDVPLLEGYRYTFLRNVSIRPNPSHFLGVINPSIIAEILKGSFDAVWINDWALCTDWLAWATTWIGMVPLLLRGESNGFTEPRGLKRAVKRAVLKAFFNQVAGFLAIGTNNANFYRSYGVSEERIFLTPYSVDNTFFMKRASELEGQRRVLRQKEGLPPDLPVILFCGKFQEKKRPLELLRAFALLNLNGRFDVSLIFVGDGPLRPMMERFVADHRLTNVYFLGFRNQQELPACYMLADVLVLPSSLEPWGLVLNEAMCFGLPLIVSDRVGAAADLVQQGINGFVYPLGSVEALASCIRQIIEDDKARQVMGRNSLGIISKWGIEESVSGILKCLKCLK